ncbi:hypothetical protein ERO13_A13G039500v2 [Gossypium hirsutum]|nr:hypothetical protein ERO13_A13G039500v2 [Gossypium hirsutum]
MAESELSYEEMRFEEQERQVISGEYAKPRTPRKQVELTAVRRSSRVADKPKPDYKDVPLEPFERLRRGYNRGHSHRDLFNRVYASAEERAYAIERAEHLESTLDSEYPSFVKPMLQSHVTGGFWLFCKQNLPHHDVMVTLVDEEGEEFVTKYLADKTGLSGGWRGFSIDHNLVDGDALVFQLVAPTEFKVYIIRAYESDDNGGGEDEKGGEDGREEEKREDEKEEKRKDGDKEADVEPDVQNRRSKRIRASNYLPLLNFQFT